MRFGMGPGERTVMKAFVPIAASLALALAPAAHAQVSCKQVNALIAYGLDDFEEITDAEIEEDYYESSYFLAGAAECTVDYFFESVYVCVWTYSSQASASAAYNTQLNAVGSCLAGWKQGAVKPDEKAADGFRTLEGYYYGGSGSNADLEFGVILEEHTANNAVDWHVVVELAYLW